MYFVSLFCSKEIFGRKICVLSQFIVYWINFHNIICTFTYQKTLPHMLFCYFLKLLKASSVSLSLSLLLTILAFLWHMFACFFVSFWSMTANHIYVFCSILFGFGMGRPRTHTASKMEPFVKKVNSWKSLLLLERAPSSHLLYNISIHILSQSKGNDKTGTFDRFFSVKNFYALKLWLTLIKKNWSRWKIKIKKNCFCWSGGSLWLFKLSDTLQTKPTSFHQCLGMKPCFETKFYQKFPYKIYFSVMWKVVAQSTNFVIYCG